MKVSWKWLGQLIDLKDIKFDELIEKLIIAGFEIEEIYELPEIRDKIIDLKLTANRNDASFLIGLAREIGTLIQKPLRYYHCHIQENYIHTISNYISYQSLNDLKINIIKNIQNRPSPVWIQNYLKSYNIKATNLLNDITEYINIKWGQDIEIFDLQKMGIEFTSSNSIQIANDGNINQIIHNRQKSYKIKPELLKYKNTIISIIGIQSNTKFQCDLNTSSIIVCGTICKSEYIQLMMKKLNIKTEKAIKHQKNILRCDFLYAYEEAIRLISTFAKGTIGQSHTYHHLQYKQPDIFVNKNIIHSVLGPIKHKSYQFLSVQKILQILSQLNFKSTYNNTKQIFKVTIPEYRINDIKRSIDIIEDIGRIYGFDKFDDKLPKIVKKGYISREREIIKNIRKILRDFGIHEVIHYSLRKKNKYEDQKNTLIELYNPLTEDQAILQENLFTNLIKIQEYNIKQKNCSIEAFEIGRIFAKNQKSQSLIKTISSQEKICIACIMGKPNFSRQSWTDKPKELSWFQAKGILEEFFEKLQANIAWKNFSESDITYINKKISHLFNRKRASIIYNPITKDNIGFFGQLDYPNNSSSEYNKNYIFEIQLLALMQTVDRINHLKYRMKPYSSYPSVTRDISIKLDCNEHFNTIRQEIINQNNRLLESIEIFNEYKRKNNNRNIGLRITYRAKDRTLNDEDIRKINKEINYILKHNT